MQLGSCVHRRLLTITTSRLDLIPLTVETLEAFVSGDRERAATLLGAAIPTWPEDTRAFQLRLDRLVAEPELAEWFVRAIVDREAGEVVGHIGCHDRPGAAYLEPWAPGGVELGYTVFTPYRRRGIVTEALAGMLAWARGEGVSRFVLSIAPDNEASTAVARHFGFAVVDRVEDPEDGLEVVWVLDES